MITDEIATLIQEKNSFINKPTEDEVKQIISEINIEIFEIWGRFIYICVDVKSGISRWNEVE